MVFPGAPLRRLTPDMTKARVPARAFVQELSDLYSLVQRNRRSGHQTVAIVPTRDDR